MNEEPDAARAIHNAAALLKLDPYESKATMISDVADEISDLLWLIATGGVAWQVHQRAELLARRLTGQAKGD